MLSSSKALPTQEYNLSENDKVICRLTTVRARTYHKMTKLFTHKKSPSSSQALPIQGYNLSENDKVICKCKLTTVRARTHHKMTEFFAA